MKSLPLGQRLWKRRVLKGGKLYKNDTTLEIVS
jgi:hypothetical protein